VSVVWLLAFADPAPNEMPKLTTDCQSPSIQLCFSHIIKPAKEYAMLTGRANVIQYENYKENIPRLLPLLCRAIVPVCHLRCAVTFQVWNPSLLAAFKMRNF